MTRLHSVFGSEKRASYADTKTADTKPFNPKHLTYEVFGRQGLSLLSAISTLMLTRSESKTRTCRGRWNLQLPRRRPSEALWHRVTVTALGVASWSTAK
ncbi:conserved membrane family protein [Mycobacterium xenopi 3993]|nr:conserved membrane family protein [Mycobacterium xenopi 3993]